MSMSEELRTSADLWLLDEAAVGKAVADYEATGILSPAERARHARLRDPGGRSRYLGGRMLVRFVLAAYTGVPPASLEFDTGPYGRPELVNNPSGLSFNLAHTSGLIAFLLTRGRLCGIDVERRPAPEDVVQAVTQFLSAEEREHLRRLGDDRADTALEYWVVKEAYLKALGAGLSRPLDSFTVRGLGSVDVRIEDRHAPAQSWQIELQQLTADHLVGLAIAGDQRAPGRIPVRILDFSAFLRAAIPPTGRAVNSETGGNGTPRATIRSWPNREESQ
jgi:4'-phosphopantetheinyl transferase